MTEYSDPNKAPPILDTMIHMFMDKGELNPDFTPLFTHQVFWQRIMLFFIVVCPFWMLLGKPYMLYQEHRKIVD